MIAPAPLPIDVPDLSGPIPEHVAEAIARLLLAAADAEIAAEQQAGDGGRPAV